MEILFLSRKFYLKVIESCEFSVYMRIVQVY